MTEETEIVTREAKHGEKMIELKIRFWDGISTTPGRIVPKHGWAGGVVRMSPNKSHGIVPENPVPFNSLLDVGAIIEQVLISHNVVLRRSRRMKKYISGDE